MLICSLPCHCYLSNTALCLCCKSKVHTPVSQWVCTLAHLEFFVEVVSCIFDRYCSLNCIKLGLCTLINYLLFCLLYYNHHPIGFLALFSSLSFRIALLCSFVVVLSIVFFCKIPKYSIEVTTCDLK